jgi:hypothetical protein
VKKSRGCFGYSINLFYWLFDPQNQKHLHYNDKYYRICRKELNQMSASNLKEKLLHELEVNFWEGWVYFGKGKNSTLFESENVIWFRTPLPFIPYSAVIKFQLTKILKRKLMKSLRNATQGGMILYGQSPRLQNPKV